LSTKKWDALLMNSVPPLIVLIFLDNSLKAKSSVLIKMKEILVNKHSNVKLTIAKKKKDSKLVWLRNKLMKHVCMGSNAKMKYVLDIDLLCSSNRSKILFRNIARNLICCHWTLYVGRMLNVPIRKYSITEILSKLDN